MLGRIAVVAVLLTSCSGSDASEIKSWQSEMKCSPGSIYSCARWNCNGHQQCSDDGTQYTACMCDPADAGMIDASTGGGQRVGSKGMSANAGRGSASSKPSSHSTDAGDTQPDAGRTPGKQGGGGMDAGKAHAADNHASDAHETKDAGKAMSDPPDMQMNGMPQVTKPSTPERCDNGVDDDGDGKVDCADSDCGALRCVDAAPSGWQGPIALQAGSSSCSGVFDQQVFTAGAEVQAAPAQCSACTCQGSCSTFVDFSLSAGMQCGAASACTTSVNGNCVEITPQCLQTATVASLETRLPSTGSCKAAEQHATLASPSWKTQVAACGLRSTGAAAGGCDAAQLCLPRESGPSYCVWREGEAACPTTGYTERSVYYKELEDTRACSACACAASSCKYSWRVFGANDSMCANPVLELTSTGQCAQVNPVMGKLRVGSTVSGDGSCTASGGESLGSVSGAKPLTVCCSR